MFSPLVDDILIVLALLFGPAGIWFTIGMAAIAIRAGQKSEKRILQEIRQALRHPRHIHMAAVRFVVSPMSLRSSFPPPSIDGHPSHPTVRPPRRPKKLPWRRPFRDVPSEMPWTPPPPEVDLPPSYQTRPGPVGPVVTRPEPGLTVARPTPSEHFITRDPGSSFRLE